MFDGEVKDISIKGLEEKTFRNDDGSKYSLVIFKDQDGDKYKFYSNRKSDGGLTSAYDMFDKGQVKNGSEVQVGFKAVPKKFTNKEGKEISYVDRFVSFFNLQGDMKQIPKKVEEVEEDLSEIPF